MTVRELLASAAEKLRKAGIEEPDQDAFYLLSEICGVTRNDLLLDGLRSVSEKMQERDLDAIEKRAAHIPCQYITGRAYFMDHVFSVNENVLIPRQDTEVLVEEVLKEAGIGAEVMDICTGSGCIAVSVKAARADVKISAIDISEDALSVAEENAGKILGSRDKISFICSDLLDRVDADKKFDIIVSNPPYVSEDEYRALAPEIREHEPDLALLAGPDGMDIYVRLIPRSAGHLKDNGWLMLEIGSSQGEAVSNLMKSCGFDDVTIIKDLAGLDRVVRGRYRENRDV